MKIAAALLAVCAWSAPSMARAGLSLGVDAGPNFVTTDIDGLEAVGIEDVGIAVAGRIGFAFDLGPVVVIPEARLAFEDAGTPDAFRGMGGLRIRLGTVFTPVVFGYAGGLVGDIEGFTWDVGGGFDFLVSPSFALGLYASYNRAENPPEFVNDASFLDDLMELPVLPGLPERWEWIQVGLSASFDVGI
ncbi:MAG: hypothetical protein ACFB9M_15665 [Myxococcota bacterium]